MMLFDLFSRTAPQGEGEEIWIFDIYQPYKHDKDYVMGWTRCG